MNPLTILERHILELIVQEEKNFDEITASIKLSQHSSKSALEKLLAKGFISFDSSKKTYFLNKNLSNQNLLELKNKELLLSESSFITKSTIKAQLNQEPNTTFKLKKAYLNSSDEKVFKAMLINLESFLEQHRTNSKNTEQKIIFWGETSYENIYTNTLNHI